MIKGFLCTVILSAIALSSHAQSSDVTYYHFNDVEQQFIGMHTGKIGRVEEYIWHPHYKKFVKDPNNANLNSMSKTFIFLQKESSHSEKSESAFQKRAVKEGLNVLDRQSLFSLGIQAAAEKFKNKQALFKRNINKIPYYGGDGNDQRYWTTCYNALSSAYNITMKAYMRSGSRMNELQKLYRDVVEYNSNLVRYITTLANKKKVSLLLAKIKNPNIPSRQRRRAVAQECMLYWGEMWGSDTVARNYRK